jgi:hypothetical protein
MKKTLQVYVYKKNLDLDCLSAFEAVKQFMNKKKCLNLTRYVCWHITGDFNQSDEQVMQALTTGSFYLLNPNKEGYYLNTIPGQNSHKTPNTHRVTVSVKSRLKSTFPDLANRLSTKTGLSVLDIEKSIIWSCLIQEDNETDAIRYVERELLNTLSYEQGILVNPIYETYSLLNIS